MNKKANLTVFDLKSPEMIKEFKVCSRGMFWACPDCGTLSSDPFEFMFLSMKHVDSENEFKAVCPNCFDNYLECKNYA